MRVVALGRATSRELAENESVDTLDIADADIDSANEFAAELPESVETAHVDVTEHDNVVEAIVDAGMSSRQSRTQMWSRTRSRTRSTSR